MLPQLLLGSLLVVVTSGVHAALTVLLVRLLRAFRPDQLLMQNSLGRSSLVTGTVLLFFLAALIEVMIWADAYLRVAGRRPSSWRSSSVWSS